MQHDSQSLALTVSFAAAVLALSASVSAPAPGQSTLPLRRKPPTHCWPRQKRSKLISSPSQRDGLFWPESDAPPTQFAAGVSKARAEGYKNQGATPTPYHGYYFRILMAQSPDARAGALDHVQHGLMIGGFGLVAWPAEYGVAGIKTFIVNQGRVIYEKDLGASTSASAEAMTTYSPDKTWRRVG